LRLKSETAKAPAQNKRHPHKIAKNWPIVYKMSSELAQPPSFVRVDTL